MYIVKLFTVVFLFMYLYLFDLRDCSVVVVVFFQSALINKSKLFDCGFGYSEY